MCECDSDPPSAYWETRPKAKKRHKCSECRGWIEPGETYLAVRGIWDGEAHSFKQCPECLALIAWAKEQSECICFSFGHTHSDILDDAYNACEPSYLAGAKERIAAIRAKRRELVGASEGSA